MMKNKLFLFGFFSLSLLFTACSGNSDDAINDLPIQGPLTITVDKTTIEADGHDKAIFTVKDANGKILTNKDNIKNLYFMNVDTKEYLDRRTESFAAIEDGTYKFIASYDTLESNVITINAQNRKSYEKYFRKIAVSQITGSWCVNCPSMTAALKKMEIEMPGRILKMAFHSSSSSASDPFNIPETQSIISQFKSPGFPAAVYNLDTMSITRNIAEIKEIIKRQRFNNPATCGIKLVSTYSNNTVSISASLTSSTGGEYDLVYAIVTDGLIAASGYETTYNYVVRGISSNYLAMSTNKKFTVEKDVEHNEPFNITISGINNETSRVVVYALRKSNNKYIIDNVTECPINGQVDYLYNE